VLFKQIEKERERESGRSALGMGIAFALLAVLALLDGQSYIHQLYNATPWPVFTDHFSFLSGLLGDSYAKALNVGVGFLAPFALLYAVSEGAVAAFRSFSHRSLPEALLAVTAVTFALCEIILLLAIRPLPVLVIATGWMVVRSVTMRILTHRGPR
jgi:hypothetical protein